jgi:hypothetical protein
MITRTCSAPRWNRPSVRCLRSGLLQNTIGAPAPSSAGLPRRSVFAQAGVLWPLTSDLDPPSLSFHLSALIPLFVLPAPEGRGLAVAPQLRGAGGPIQSEDLRSDPDLTLALRYHNPGTGPFLRNTKFCSYVRAGPMSRPPAPSGLYSPLPIPSFKPSVSC